MINMLSSIKSLTKMEHKLCMITMKIVDDAS